MRKGDWECSRCANINRCKIYYSGNRLILAPAIECSSCSAAREINSNETFLGDWQCEGCSTVNYGNDLSIKVNISSSDDMYEMFRQTTLELECRYVI